MRGMTRGWVGVFVIGVLGWRLAGVASAQNPPPAAVSGLEELRTVREAVFGGLRNQIGTLPIPSGGAFTYDFDPATGVFTRTTDTLGPIFADRAETIGRGKFTLTVNATYHSYDELDGVDLSNGDLQTITQVVNQFGSRVALRSIREQVTAEVYTVGATYGVTDTIDVSLTLPIVRVRLTENVARLGFRDCDVNFVNCGPFRPDSPPLFSMPSSNESTGIGDLDVRGKWHFLSLRDVLGGRAGLAASLNVKMPTGDSGTFRSGQAILGPNQLVTETRFAQSDPPRGTGVFRFKPQLIASGSWYRFEPHANVGFELGETTGVTNDFIYAVGVDAALHPAVTLAFDVLGRYSLDVKRRKAQGVLGQAGLDQRIADLAAGRTPAPPETADPHIVNGSIGLKINLFDTVVAIVNVLFPLNGGNLRDDLTPTAGLEWTF